MTRNASTGSQLFVMTNWLKMIPHPTKADP